MQFYTPGFVLLYTSLPAWSWEIANYWPCFHMSSSVLWWHATLASRVIVQSYGSEFLIVCHNFCWYLPAQMASTKINVHSSKTTLNTNLWRSSGNTLFTKVPPSGTTYFVCSLNGRLRPWKGVNSDLRYWKSKNIIIIYCKSWPFSLDFEPKRCSLHNDLLYLHQPSPTPWHLTNLYSSPSCFQTLAYLSMPSHPTTHIPHPPVNVSFTLILRLNAWHQHVQRVNILTIPIILRMASFYIPSHTKAFFLPSFDTPNPTQPMSVP